MKKAFSIILILTLCLFAVSCSKYDIDLTGKENIYDELVQIITEPNDYIGKTVAITSTVSAVYNFSENKITRFLLTEFNESGEKRVLYEIRATDNNYPKIGSKATITGVICEGGYIDISEYKTEINKSTYDIDALDLSAKELFELIENFGKDYHQSPNYQKTLRIIGNCVVRDGYKYLIGLDSDGKPTWGIELYDQNGNIVFPDTKENKIHPIEITGKLSNYFENNIAYACIEVETLHEIESILK